MHSPLALLSPSEHMNDAHKLYARLHAEHGPIIRLRIPFQAPWVMVFDPDLVRQVYNNTGSPVNSPAFESLHKYRTRARPDLYPVSKGLLGSQEEEWAENRGGGIEGGLVLWVLIFNSLL